MKKSSASRQQHSSMVAKNALSESHNAWLMSLSPAFAKLPRFKPLFVAKNKTELCLYVEQLHRPVELNVALNIVVWKGEGGGPGKKSAGRLNHWRCFIFRISFVLCQNICLSLRLLKYQAPMEKREIARLYLCKAFVQSLSYNMST